MSPRLHIQVDSGSGIPIYRQIMDQVRYYVAAGSLAGGDKLPSIRELAKRLHINPTTITKAYKELQHAGVVDLRQGKGVFIAEAAARMSPAKVEDELRRMAAALATAAGPMGASFEAVSRILREEMDRLWTTDGKD